MDQQLSKPGEKALIAMKSLSKNVSIFKIPKPPKKTKEKMKILTEERYIEVGIYTTKKYLNRFLYDFR